MTTYLPATYTEGERAAMAWRGQINNARDAHLFMEQHERGGRIERALAYRTKRDAALSEVACAEAIMTSAGRQFRPFNVKDL